MKNNNVLRFLNRLDFSIYNYSFLNLIMFPLGIAFPYRQEKSYRF